MSSCPQCAHDNPPGSRFCNECGTALPRACPSCGHENSGTAKFCNECGAALQNAPKAVSQPPAQAPVQAVAAPEVTPPTALQTPFTAPAKPSLAGERRRCTVLFADLSGSTALGERFDAEDVFDVMNSCFAGLATIIERQGGYIVKYLGDCIMALFGAPVAHGDDPQRALHAALEMQVWLEAFSRDLEAKRGVPFRMRIGLNFGPVIAGGVGGDSTKSYDVLGDTVNVAQRLESIAEPGTVYLSDALRRLTARDFEFTSQRRVRVKGRAEEIEVYRVLGARQSMPDTLGSGRFIGRAHEAQLIGGAVESTTAGSGGGLITLAGEPGIGKTRLMETATQMAAERAAPVHFVSCVEREAVRPFALVRRLLADLCGLDEETTPVQRAAQLASTLTELSSPEVTWLPALQNLIAPTAVPLPVDEEARKNLILHGISQVFAALCREAPRLLLVDDAQWLDELSGAALEALSREVALEGRLLIIVAHWPGWSHSWPDTAQSLKLGGLNQAHCLELIEDLVGDATLPTTLLKTIVARSGGNPYYLREVLQQMIEAGHLRHDGSVWREGESLGNFVVPDTIYSALVARLDRLDMTARATLQDGAVVGLEFPVRLLKALREEPTPANGASPTAETSSVATSLSLLATPLGHNLRRLEALDFLNESEPLPDWAFRFRHAALREVAYDTLLIAQREARHTLIAGWLEAFYAGRESEVAAQLAHHHEKAGHRLPAARHAIVAGEGARALFANADALRFFERALTLLDDSPEAQRLALDAHAGRGAVQTRLGDFDEAQSSWQAALALCDLLTPDEAALRRATFLRRLAQCQRETGSDETTTTLRQAFRALGHLATPDAQRERSLIIGDWGFTRYRAGRYVAAARLGRWSLALAEKAGSTHEQGVAANLLGQIAEARGQHEEALSYFEQSRRTAEDSHDFSALGAALHSLGAVHFQAGRLSEAEQCWSRARELWEKTGDHVELASTLNHLGNLHLARGDFAQALQLFDDAGARFRHAGHRFGEAATLAVAGETFLEEDQWDAAIERLSAAYEMATALDALDLKAYTSTTLARALLERGDSEDALRHCKAALELSRRIGNPAFEAIGRRTRGRIALECGDLSLAESELRAALELCNAHDLKQEEGRTLLTLAQWHKTQDQDEDWRRCLSEARAIFEEIGALADARRATL